MKIADLIEEFEPQARSEVGEFFGIDKESLRTPIPIDLTTTSGTGWGSRDGISFFPRGLEQDLESRTRYGIMYTPAEYVRGVVFEEVAHHLEEKHFGSRKYNNLMPFQQILFGEMLGGFGLARAGVLDKEIGFQQNRIKYLEISLPSTIGEELAQRKHTSDRRALKKLQDLLDRGNLGSYQSWSDYYKIVYPKQGGYLMSHSNYGLGVAYLYGRLLTQDILRNKEPVQSLLRMSYPKLEQKLTPTLMSMNV